MRSTIYESDTIDNRTHEFGESNEPRVWVMVIGRDGRGEPAAFTQHQIDVAIARARREPVDEQEFRRRYHLRDLTVRAASVTGVAVLLALAVRGIPAWLG